MVGNGVTNNIFDGNALVPFVHGMVLISEEQSQDVVDACKGKYYDTIDSICNTKLVVIGQEVSKTQHL
jgi:serine carboxypeptidase-like clade 1